MKLEDQIAYVIKTESEKLIARYHEYHNKLHNNYIRNRKRLGTSAPDKQILKPDYWSVDQKFNPFYVRRKYKSIAKSIANSIINKTYSPNKPYIKHVPKASGGFRDVMIYQIPDAAVSKLFFNRLLAKNKHRFSSFSYAYRNDRNVHFAIQDMSVDLTLNDRTFVAEFDFSDFFGSISHDFLRAQFDKNGFYISEEEVFVINSFLKNRAVGIPQGTSISLFLANLTCWKLDQALEKEGVKFSRYADDTIIWTQDYTKICKAFDIISKFSTEAGVRINEAKSDGISLLIKKGLKAEMTSKTSLDFLGYEVGVGVVSIKNKSVKRIQKQISYLLYRNLIQPLKQTNLAGQVIPANNQDENFLTAIMQIRRFMYGGLSNELLQNYIAGRTSRMYFKGIMSYYPLINDEDQLHHLDGWLVSVIYRSLQLRAKLLAALGYSRFHSFPFNIKRNNLVQQCANYEIYNKHLLEIPSFTLIQKALQKGLLDQGIEKLMNPKSNLYSYNS